MAVAPLDVYRIVADPTLGPDAKKQQIDMLYGIAAPANGPDVRTADYTVPADSPMFGSGAAPPPVASDAGGMSGMSEAPAVSPAPAPAPVASVPQAPPPVEPPAAGGMSTIDPAALAAAAASKASTPARAAAPEAPGEAPTGTDEAAFNAGVRQIFGSALRGSPARRVGAHDQPVSSTVARAGAVPDEIKERIATDAQAEAGLAVDEGEQAGEAHLNAAIAADNQGHQLRSDRDQLVAQQKELHAHVQDMDTHFEQLVKDTAVKPSDWWTSKDAGHKVLSLIGAVMFGLAGDPKGLEKVIDDDLALKQVARDKMLGARKSRIDDFRARLLSPEAQQQAERALSAQAIAADATRLAEAAAAPEARLRGMQVAQHFQTLSDQASAAMAEHEAGTITTHIAHVPERVVGGAPNPLAVIKQGKEAGLNPEGVVRTLTGGNYSADETPDEAKRRVTFGAGEQVGYVANEGAQQETQHMANAISSLKGTYGRIRDLMKSGGHTLAGPEKAALEAQVAAGMQQLQAMAKGEGANARMAGEMLEKLEPLTGANALKTGMLDANAKAQLDEAYRIVDNQEETIKGTLTPSPKTKPSGGRIQTLGKSKKSLDFEKE